MPLVHEKDHFTMVRFIPQRNLQAVNTDMLIAAHRKTDVSQNPSPSCKKKP